MNHTKIDKKTTKMRTVEILAKIDNLADKTNHSDMMTIMITKTLSIKRNLVCKKTQQLEWKNYTPIMRTVTNLPSGWQPCWQCKSFCQDDNHASLMTNVTTITLSRKWISAFIQPQQFKMDKYATILRRVTNLPLGGQPSWQCKPWWQSCQKRD